MRRPIAVIVGIAAIAAAYMLFMHNGGHGDNAAAKSMATTTTKGR